MLRPVGSAGQTTARERRVTQTYFTLTLRPDHVVWLQRTAVPYPAIDDLHTAYDDFLAVVDDWLLDQRIKKGLLGKSERIAMGWLYDLRGGPAQRGDPEIEHAIQARRPDLLRRSPVLAILTATAAGRMQVARITDDSANTIGIFGVFDEALSWLHEKIPAAFPGREPA